MHVGLVGAFFGVAQKPFFFLIVMIRVIVRDPDLRERVGGADLLHHPAADGDDDFWRGVLERLHVQIAVCAHLLLYMRGKLACAQVLYASVVDLPDDAGHVLSQLALGQQGVADAFTGNFRHGHSPF